MIKAAAIPFYESNFVSIRCRENLHIFLLKRSERGSDQRHREGAGDRRPNKRRSHPFRRKDEIAEAAAAAVAEISLMTPLKIVSNPSEKTNGISSLQHICFKSHGCKNFPFCSIPRVFSPGFLRIRVELKIVVFARLHQVREEIYL